MILASNQSESLMNAEVIDRNRLNGVRHSVISLSDYCRINNWAGYDPYDALNSRLFACTPFFRSRMEQRNIWEHKIITSPIVSLLVK
jgi:hypothetical protein